MYKLTVDEGYGEVHTYTYSTLREAEHAQEDALWFGARHATIERVR